MAQLFLTESVESEEITFSSEGTRITSRKWLAGCAAEAFRFFDVNSVKGRRGPLLSGCSLRIGGDWGTPCCGACRGAPGYWDANSTQRHGASPRSIYGVRRWFSWCTVRSVPPRMPMWLWCWRRSASNLNANVAIELTRVVVSFFNDNEVIVDQARTTSEQIGKRDGERASANK
ncbi:hypothetical protein BHM03_00037665 [Ensete ventricosum]|nr:hypothetical protein BHM03_00037665 [Ensete ventricosum]